MLQDLLIHPTTHFILEAFAKQPPHALLFIGAEGLGKLTLAKAWASSAGADTNTVQTISPDERGTITVEMIRDLYRMARSKREGLQVIIIDHAECMSVEAENAFLKLLEEPREGTTFILTTPHMEALLPTILSRSQRVFLPPITTVALETFARDHPTKPPQSTLTQLLFIAQGRPATLVRLLENNDELDEARLRMQQAKELLVAPTYERFIVAYKLSADRTNCVTVLEAMLNMVSIQLKKSSHQALERWIMLSQLLEEALQHLKHNGNIKAQLLKLFSSY